MMRDYLLYLSDVVQNMQAAERFIGTMTFDEFTADQKTAYAVVRCFEIIGEATKNVPDSIRATCPSVPWPDLARMRDKCIQYVLGNQISDSLGCGERGIARFTTANRIAAGRFAQ